MSSLAMAADKSQTQYGGNMEKNAKRKTPLYESRKCAICGEQFQPARYNQVTCSDSCRYQRHLQLIRQKSGCGQPKQCEICGKEFIPDRRDQKCCSDACKGRYILDYGKKRYREVYQGQGLKRKRELEKENSRLREKIAELEIELARYRKTAANGEDAR